MKSKTVKVTGAIVREWAREQNIAVGARGRFAPDVIKQFNSAHKGSMSYNEGNGKTVTIKVTKVAASGRARKEVIEVSMSEARNLAGKAGTRGPLSKADLEKAGTAYTHKG